MKLKYYLRTVGIAIIVTALLMGFSGGKKEQLTDREIRQRALELGMVDSSNYVLSDLSKVPDKTQEEPEEKEPLQVASASREDDEGENQPQESQEVDGGREPEESQEVGDGLETQEPGAESGQESQGSQTPDVEIQQDGTVSVTIRGGESSMSVCNKLKEAGLIEDAAEYDTYLCQNGYDKRLSVGTYAIPVGSTQEEIAKILTRK